MPWSDTWQIRGAITEMRAVAEQAQLGNAEAQYKYARIHLVTEDKSEGITWLRKSSAQGYVPAMNGLAWILATDPDGRFRNGEEAVRWARQACEEDGWETAAYIDTLAAAYAEHEQWEDAIVTQRRAMEQVSEVEGNAASYDSRLQKYLERKKVRD